MKPSLDSTDKRILELLQENGRMPVKEIAAKLSLSTTPIFERIKKLEKKGIIEHYTVILNPQKLGKKLHAFAHISLKNHDKQLVKEFVDKIVDIPEVMECHYSTGSADFIIKILVEDMEKYKEFVIEKLFDIPNIGKIESYLSLEVKKKTNIIPID